MMVPQPNLTPAEIRPWLLDLRANPLTEAEERELMEADPSIAWSARASLEDVNRLDPQGVPDWWPLRHQDYQDGRKLTGVERMQWFLQFLSGQLSPVQDDLRASTPSERRQTIAQYLFHTLSMASEPDLPTPDSL